MTPELLAGAAAILLSLVFTYVPGLNKKYAAIDPTYQRLIMLGALVVIAGASFGLVCAKLFTDVIPLQCTEAGAQELAKIFVLAVIANQATYTISPKPQAVTAAKSSRE